MIMYCIQLALFNFMAMALLEEESKNWEMIRDHLPSGLNLLFRGNMKIIFYPLYLLSCSSSEGGVGWKTPQ